MTRLFKEKFVTLFSRYGAKIHFNKINFENNFLISYGIIRKKDLIQDLNYWETLWVSSMLMRPVTVLQNDEDIFNSQLNNLRSATAFAALTTKTNSSEVDFYKKIVTIPHYQSYSKYFKLLDNENISEIVSSKLDEFRNIYEPIMYANFHDNFEIHNGIFKKDVSKSTTEHLLKNLNDNVHQNLFSIVSPLKYDNQRRFYKQEMSKEILDHSIDDKLSRKDEDAINHKLQVAVDKILLTHKHSRIFLLIMSGPILGLLFAIKYMLKLFIIYYIFKGKGHGSKTESSR